MNRVGIVMPAALVALLSGCGGSSGDDPPAPGPTLHPPPPVSYSVGGTVTGLTGGSLVLQMNGADDLTVSADGPFTFATALANGTSYAVSVLTQPAGQACQITDGSGMIGSAGVTQVAIACAADPATATRHRLLRQRFDLDGNGTVDAERTYTYDALGRPMTENYVYTGDGVADTDFGSFSIDAPDHDLDTSYGYDAAGHLTLWRNVTPDDTIETAYDYGADDLLDVMTIEVFDSAGALQNRVRFDLLYTTDRITSTEMRANGATTPMQSWTLTYDAAGRVDSDQNLNAGGGVASQRDYTYTATGRIERIRETIPTVATYDLTVDFTYDTTGRIRERSSAQASPAESYAWQYTYDAQGLIDEWRIDLDDDGSIEAVISADWEAGPCEDTFIWAPRSEPNFVASVSHPRAPGSGFAVLPLCASP